MLKINHSEKAFQDYLDLHHISYEKDYEVSDTGKNVDFFVHASNQHVYCDVKEVRRSTTSEPPKVYAKKNIQNDLKELRSKFKKNRPDHALLLISMNYSNQVFTGWTIAEAMLGQIEFVFDVDSGKVIKPVHITGANASTTPKHNRSISGVYVYDRNLRINNIYANPYAEFPILQNTFPKTQVVEINTNLSPQDLKWLSDWRY